MGGYGQEPRREDLQAGVARGHPGDRRQNRRGASAFMHSTGLASTPTLSRGAARRIWESGSALIAFRRSVGEGNQQTLRTRIATAPPIGENSEGQIERSRRIMDDLRQGYIESRMSRILQSGRKNSFPLSSNFVCLLLVSLPSFLSVSVFFVYSFCRSLVVLGSTVHPMCPAVLFPFPFPLSWQTNLFFCARFQKVFTRINKDGQATTTNIVDEKSKEVLVLSKVSNFSRSS